MLKMPKEAVLATASFSDFQGMSNNKWKTREKTKNKNGKQNIKIGKCRKISGKTEENEKFAENHTNFCQGHISRIG